MCMGFLDDFTVIFKTLICLLKTIDHLNFSIYQLLRASAKNFVIFYGFRRAYDRISLTAMLSHLDQLCKLRVQVNMLHI